MKNALMLITVLFAVLPAKADKDFPLVLHVTAVEMHQSTTGVSGSIVNGTGDVDGGRSYTWHLSKAKIDGDTKTYGLATGCRPFKKCRWLAMGDYRARWNKNGTLEVLSHDENGKLFHERLRVMSEE